jgi:hypothetical protein
MIVDSNYSYVWTDALKQGIKFQIDTPSANSTPETPSNNQTPDLNQQVNYQCSDWIEDDSFFIPPTDITFQSFSKPSSIPSNTVKNPNDTSTPSSSVSSQCAVCDNIPAGEGRDACKTQLQCP